MRHSTVLPLLALIVLALPSLSTSPHSPENHIGLSGRGKRPVKRLGVLSFVRRARGVEEQGQTNTPSVPHALLHHILPTKREISSFGSPLQTGMLSDDSNENWEDNDHGISSGFEKIKEIQSSKEAGGDEGGNENGQQTTTTASNGFSGAEENEGEVSARQGSPTQGVGIEKKTSNDNGSSNDNGWDSQQDDGESVGKGNPSNGQDSLSLPSIQQEKEQSVVAGNKPTVPDTATSKTISDQHKQDEEEPSNKVVDPDRQQVEGGANNQLVDVNPQTDRTNVGLLSVPPDNGSLQNGSSYDISSNNSQQSSTQDGLSPTREIEQHESQGNKDLNQDVEQEKELARPLTHGGLLNDPTPSRKEKTLPQTEKHGTGGIPPVQQENDQEPSSDDGSKQSHDLPNKNSGGLLGADEIGNQDVSSGDGQKQAHDSFHQKTGGLLGVGEEGNHEHSSVEQQQEIVEQKSTNVNSGGLLGTVPQTNQGSDSGRATDQGNKKGLTPTTTDQHSSGLFDASGQGKGNDEQRSSEQDSDALLQVSQTGSERITADSSRQAKEQKNGNPQGGIQTIEAKEGGTEHSGQKSSNEQDTDGLLGHTTLAPIGGGQQQDKQYPNTQSAGGLSGDSQDGGQRPSPVGPNSHSNGDGTSGDQSKLPLEKTTIQPGGQGSSKNDQEPASMQDIHTADPHAGGILESALNGNQGSSDMDYSSEKDKSGDAGLLAAILASNVSPSSAVIHEGATTVSSQGANLKGSTTSSLGGIPNQDVVPTTAGTIADDDNGAKSLELSPGMTMTGTNSIEDTSQSGKAEKGTEKIADGTAISAFNLGRLLPLEKPLTATEHTDGLDIGAEQVVQPAQVVDAPLDKEAAFGYADRQKLILPEEHEQISTSSSRLSPDESEQPETVTKAIAPKTINHGSVSNPAPIASTIAPQGAPPVIPKDSVMIAILFKPVLNWAFLSSSPDTVAQMFLYMPSIVGEAVNLTPDKISTIRLQQHTLDGQARGPAEGLSLYLAYVPLSVSKKLQGLVKNELSIFYTAPVNGVAKALVTNVDPTYDILTMESLQTANKKASLQSNQDSSATLRNALIGVGSALAACILALLAWRILKANRKQQSRMEAQQSVARGVGGRTPTINSFTGRNNLRETWSPSVHEQERVLHGQLAETWEHNDDGPSLTEGPGSQEMVSALEVVPPPSHSDPFEDGLVDRASEEVEQRGSSGTSLQRDTILSHLNNFDSRSVVSAASGLTEAQRIQQSYIENTASNRTYQDIYERPQQFTSSHTYGPRVAENRIRRRGSKGSLSNSSIGRPEMQGNSMLI